MDTKVHYVIATVRCETHLKMVGDACWSFPARTDNLPPRLGICMTRAANSGILLPQVKQQVLKAA